MQNIIVGDKIPKEQLERIEAEMVASAIAQVLVPKQDFNNPSDIKSDFGFIYMLGEYPVAMFKIFTDKKTIFIGHQMGGLSRLDNKDGEKNFALMVEMMKGVNGRFLEISG